MTWMYAILRRKHLRWVSRRSQSRRLPFDVGELLSSLDRMEDVEAARYATGIVRDKVTGRQRELLDAILLVSEEGGPPTNDRLAEAMGMHVDTLRALLAKRCHEATTQKRAGGSAEGGRRGDGGRIPLTR